MLNGEWKTCVIGVDHVATVAIPVPGFVCLGVRMKAKAYCTPSNTWEGNVVGWVGVKWYQSGGGDRGWAMVSAGVMLREFRRGRGQGSEDKGAKRHSSCLQRWRWGNRRKWWVNSVCDPEDSSFYLHLFVHVYVAFHKGIGNRFVLQSAEYFQ